MNTNVQTSEIVSYVLPIANLSDVQKSHFQLSKMQKMYISKRIRNKYKTDVSWNYEFSNRNIYTYVRH